MIDRRVHVLRALAQHGTVTATAEALHYTPSAISHQLRQLAADLDTELLEPVGRGVRLTDAAHTVLAYAEEMSLLDERLRSELRQAGPDTGGTLTMCGFSTAATHLLPPAAARLRRTHAPRKLTLIEAEPHRCFDLLLTGEADLALIVPTTHTPPTSDTRFEQHHLLDDPLDVLVPLDHPLVGRETVELSELAGENWIIGRPGSAYHSLVFSACTTAGFTPAVAHHADEWDTGTSMVSHGFGILLVPRLARLNPEWPVTRVPLSGQSAPARRIVAATRRGAWSDPLITAAIEAIGNTAARLVPTPGT